MKTLSCLFLVSVIASGALIFSGWNNSNLGVAGTTELEGKWVGKEHYEGWTFDFSDNYLKGTSPNPQMWYEGKFNLNPNVDPKEIDFLIEKSGIPQYTGLTSLGIYKIEEETLTLALSEPGKNKRPSSFSEPGGAMVFILTRQ